MYRTSIDGNYYSSKTYTSPPGFDIGGASVSSIVIPSNKVVLPYNINTGQSIFSDFSSGKVNPTKENLKKLVFILNNYLKQKDI